MISITEYIKMNRAERYGFLGSTIQGCIEQIQVEPYPGRKDKHLLGSCDGKSEQQLWFSAHYDTFKEMPGALDNSAAVLSLVGAFNEYTKQAIRNNSIRIILFDNEETDDSERFCGITQKQGKQTSEGRWTRGSAYFVSNYEKEFSRYFAGLINLEVLGKGTFELYKRSSKEMIQNSADLNAKIAGVLKSLQLNYTFCENSPDSDHTSFTRAGLAATVLARRDEQAWKRIHTERDDITNIDISSIDENVRVLLELMNSRV